MQKFTFRLEPALSWRRSQLQVERHNLAKLIAEETRLSNELHALIAARRDAVEALQTSTAFEAIELRSLSAYLVGATGRENTLQTEIARQRQVIGQQRQRVLEAERQVKLLEKLRDKKLKDWRLNLDREIQTLGEESWMAANYDAVERGATEA